MSSSTLTKSIWVALVVCFLSIAAFSQTDPEDRGRKPTAPKTPRRPPPGKSPSERTGPPTPRKPKSPPQVPRTAFGEISVTVNETGSRVELWSRAGGAVQPAVITEQGAAAVFRRVPAGSYVVTVRKPNFFDESREVSVAAGRAPAVTVRMRPSVAVISVTAAVPGASVEVEGIGEYEGRTGDLAVNPGSFRINVYKDGYEPVSRELVLQRPGERADIVVELKPLSADSLMATALEKYGAKLYDDAISAANIVLLADAYDGRANLVVGYSLFGMPDPKDAAVHLLRAAGSGEVPSLLVRVYTKEKGAIGLPAGDLRVSRGTIDYVGGNRKDLNFSFARGNASQITVKTDDSGVSYLEMKVRGNFNGREDRKTVRIYSDAALVSADKKGTICQSCTAQGCPCRTEPAVLSKLLELWQLGNFHFPKTEYGLVREPSSGFAAYELPGFQFKYPSNWRLVSSAEAGVLVTPEGGFSSKDGSFSHGVHGLVGATVPGGDMLEVFTERLLSSPANSRYAKSGTETVTVLGRQFPSNILRGRGSNSGNGETVQIVAFPLGVGKHGCIVLVVPTSEREKYRGLFRRILGSVRRVEIVEM